MTVSYGVKEGFCISRDEFSSTVNRKRESSSDSKDGKESKRTNKNFKIDLAAMASLAHYKMMEE